ncbi:NACHT domain-containing protein [Puia dinghuensis]|uniref:RNA polymerase sigma factor 70 region 4 type 2 domain-containing protein n=1 Tax=Puia dinghuensis TaxID=1792502 RepID=A0A8J2UJI8_9BACT|nr:sigma-70 family RNA polymerase sigma factor [Puia dinghuensis]GGB26340.1 hypothetical protein GCM10011511_57880 [Puia dinghuensis]
MDAKASPDTIRDNLHELKKVLCITNNKFLLTCRTHFFRNKVQAEVLADFDVAYIPEWGEIELQEYLQKRFSEKWPQLLGKISGTHNLPELARTPLFLEMIAETLPKLGDEVKRVELYRVYTDTWIKNQSRRKGALLSPVERRGFVRELAMKLHLENRPSCHYKEFRELLRQFLEQFQSKDDSRFETDNVVQMDYLRNDVQTCTFLTRDSSGNYAFRHKSFMEFFVAETIAEDLQGGSGKFLNGGLLPVEIRGFLVDILREAAPQELLLNLLSLSEEGALCDNLLSLLSQLQIPIPYPDQLTVETDSNTQLSMRFMRGEKEAFNEMFETFSRELWYFLAKRFRSLVSDDEIEDVVVDSLINAWTRREQLESVRNLRQFIYQNAQNRITDLLKQKNVERETCKDLYDLDQSAEDFSKTAELIALEFALLRNLSVDEAIKKLPAVQQKVIERSFFLNQPASSIAKEIGISLAAVYKHRQRALAALRKLIKVL